MPNNGDFSVSVNGIFLPWTYAVTGSVIVSLLIILIIWIASRNRKKFVIMSIVSLAVAYGAVEIASLRLEVQPPVANQNPFLRVISEFKGPGWDSFMVSITAIAAIVIVSRTDQQNDSKKDQTTHLYPFINMFTDDIVNELIKKANPPSIICILLAKIYSGNMEYSDAGSSFWVFVHDKLIPANWFGEKCYERLLRYDRRVCAIILDSLPAWNVAAPRITEELISVTIRVPKDDQVANNLSRYV